ncbi:hypothetical protein ACUIJQ_01175 [Levilactobacillus hammesii]|uniref:S-layer protein n=1 Tax=Levilactobacillus hammesii DSM 16381 TaxID=1423753 RepID=A0A0R1UM30_9LACO|nr:hypothetical protein [Levilactobacillus hammesii]KRL94269.1 hypothetical protein FD28_GL000414 [Levilactobacillus hammesii DSM 16381]
MQSSLKKSLYLGLAALSFAGVAAVSTTANAKSYAKAGAYSTLKSDATTRNVEATGSNALYTKPGTVKGAKVVASTKTMKTLASSKKSADYFRAYGVKTTNRGSVYYRVVSMNGKYRGYIYGGKADTAFAGGIKSANTTVDKTATDAMVGKTVYFKAPGTANVTWTAPKYTQYKASKNVVNTKPFTKDTLTVTKAATKTREGSLYYYVQDATHPSVSGWIYSGAVTTDSSNAFDEVTDVKVNFVGADGKTVTSTILQNLAPDDTTIGTTAKTTGTAVGTAAKNAFTADGSTVASKALTGTGYALTSPLSNANQAALLAAKTGATVNLTVTKNNTVTTPLFFKTANSTSTSSDSETLSQYTTGTANATTVVLPSLSAGFKGIDGANFTGATLEAFAKANGLTTLYTPTYTTSVNGKDVNTYVKYTLANGQDGVYGAKSAATLVYTANVVTGSTSPADASTSSSSSDGSIIGSVSTSSSSSSSSSSATSDANAASGQTGSSEVK